jgi:hypothetical protein
MDTSDYNYPNVPSHTAEALANYWIHGYEPGGFLTSMLVGDLYRAAARADHWNKDAMGHIATMIAEVGPEGSWGNPDIVASWLNKGPAFQHYEKQRLMDILKKDHVEKTYDF